MVDELERQGVKIKVGDIIERLPDRYQEFNWIDGAKITEIVWGADYDGYDEDEEDYYEDEDEDSTEYYVHLDVGNGVSETLHFDAWIDRSVRVKEIVELTETKGKLWKKQL